MRSSKFIFSSLFIVSAVLFGTLGVNHAFADTEKADTLNLDVKDIQRLATTIAQIKRYYVEPVDEHKLFDYAIAGMLTNLDPHSDYLDPSALQDLEMTTSGKFGGIGIEVIPENGFLKIISPIDNTPAYRAGVKAGDLIIRINNKLVGDMTLREAIDMIRGEPNSKVSLTILHKDSKKPIDMSIPREIIKVQTIKPELLDSNIGYIRLSFFQNETKTDLINAINSLKQQSKGQLQGLILDLRNNPGGLLDSAVDVTNNLLDSKHLKYNNLIVYTKGRIETSQIKAVANASDILQGLPMVVLINEGSASAAEIVAGALQDQGRATIIGEKSFGKGSVQTVLPIDNDSGIKLTTALYYTPSGRSIQAKGIEPDITVEDIKIPKSKPEDQPLVISEADLSKHLKDTNATVEANNVSNDKKVQEYLYNDFQLYEAITVLEGMVKSKQEKISAEAPATSGAPEGASGKNS